MLSEVRRNNASMEQNNMIMIFSHSSTPANEQKEGMRLLRRRMMRKLREQEERKAAFEAGAGSGDANTAPRTPMRTPTSVHTPRRTLNPVREAIQSPLKPA
jgi:hypothetical protein